MAPKAWRSLRTTIVVDSGADNRTPAPGFTVTVPVPNGVRGLAIADLTGDGRLDIALCDTSSRTVTALVQGEAAPLTFTARALVELLSAPRALEAGDLDGDGAMDLAAICSPRAFVGVPLLVRQDRAGILRPFLQVPQVTFTIGFNACLADVNGDGDLDLLVGGAASSPGVGVLEGR